MAYYLTITKNSLHRTLDITLLDEFKRLSKFKGGSFSLEEIDECTSKFSNELELKRALYNKGIISLEDIQRELAIRNLYQGTLEKVTYGLVYKEQKKYLDPEYLRTKMQSLKSDKIFLEKLTSRYRNSYCNNLTISDIRNCLSTGFDNDLYKLINKFIIKEIYKENKETGEVSIKYKSLHDLAMFVYNYEKNKDLEEKGISLTTETNLKKKQLLELSKELAEGKNMPKKKILKKEPIEGQLSLFD